MQWFKHQSDANMDAKLQEVLLDYGLEGYGLYFYCLELIVNKISSDNITFELEHDARIIARNTGSTPQKVQEMMTRFIDLGLFTMAQSGNVACLKLLTRLDSSMTSNKNMRQLIIKAKEYHNHDGVMISHDSVMEVADSVMQEEKRIDKNRIEENINRDSHHAPAAAAEVNKPKRKQIPYQSVVDLYHELLPNHPQVYKLTPTRKGFIKSLWNDEKDGLPDMDNWQSFFEHVNTSDFLTGKAPPQQGRSPFIADLEWMTKPANFVKIAEGKYNGL